MIIKTDPEDADLTAETISAVFEKCAAVALKWEVDSRCPGRRELQVYYRALLLLVVVSHSNEVIRTNAMAHVRSRGGAANKMAALWFDDEVLSDEDDQLEQHAIADGLLAETQTMREMINNEARRRIPPLGL